MKYDMVKLKELCTVNQGLQIPISKRFKEPGENRFFYITVQFLKESGENYYIENPPKSVTCTENEILVVRTGNTGQVITGVAGCFHNNFFKVTPNERVFSRYLYYALNNKKMHDAMLNAASGTTIPDLKHSSFYDLEIPLPTIDIQKKISKILDNICNKLKLNNKINNNLFDLMKRTYIEWFKNYNIPNTRFEFKNSELGRIPSNWNVKHLKDVFFFQEGPGIRNWQYVENDGTKFINIRCIKDKDLELETANMISNEEAQGKYKHFMLDEWDVVVSTSGTLGRNQIIRKEHLPLCLNTSVIRFKPINDFDEYAFMYNYLISDEFLNLLDVMATGSAQRNFGPMHLNKIDLVYPSKEIMVKFNNLIFPIIENIQNNKAENMKLTQLRDTLLPKLMNGEIDLDNIEI